MELQKLEALLGAKQVVDGENNNKYSWQSKYFRPTIKPLPIVYVKSIEELAEVLKLATLEKWSVVPLGGGTKLKLGNAPKKADFFLSLEQMSQILEHEAADLTTTVQAGCKFAKFQESLGNLGQYLPLNPPFAEFATLGGVIATSSYGPSRLSGGTVRDWLIGIKVVTANGEISKAGGKVVKNVAGYDLMKLYAGSFGTLCIIAEASFKLRPKPTEESLVLGVFNFSNLSDASRLLLDSQLEPNALELLNFQAAKNCFPHLNIKSNQWVLAAHFVGSNQAIKYQIDSTKEFWSDRAENITCLSGSDKEYLGWQKVIDFTSDYLSLGLFRATSLPSKCISLVSIIEKALSSVTKNFALLAHVGNGVVRGFISQSEFLQNGVAEINLEDEKYLKLYSVIKELRDVCEKSSGVLVLEDDTFQDKLDRWGTSPISIALMRTIKQKLDPLEILNPGRFLGGI
ncbi:MAG: FAD-binding oxidoreductase [Acidobacteria bacterium]|nr:FAD-binding oxidoreductase [Acidobacteriota bacterium]